MSEIFRPAFPGQSSPYVSYNNPFAETCARHVKEYSHSRRIYIIASSSLAKNTRAVKQLKDALGDDVVGSRLGMKPHTYLSEVLEISKEVKTLKVNLVVTLGAGSLTDGAKIVVLAVSNGIDTLEGFKTIQGEGTWRKETIFPSTIPIICIPTTLSGGEYSNFAGGTDDTTLRKHLYAHPSIGPKLVILDPELCKTTPDRVWYSTGIRAVDHCVETMCSTQSTEAGNTAATGALQLLIPGLLRSKASPSDLKARLNCQLGALGAMAAAAQGVPMGGSHGIGHQLGPLGVGHGETSCILLPAVMKFNSSVNHEKQDIISQILWADASSREVLQRRGLTKGEADLGDILDEIIRELGLPRTLTEFGIGKDGLDDLAERSLGDKYCKTNPIPLIKKSQVLEILQMVV